MEPDIDALEEQHYERFLDRCDQNFDLRNRVVEVFGEPEEQYLIWKDDADLDDVFNRCFEIMYDWDAEFFVCDPYYAIGDYQVERDRKQKKNLIK